MMTLNKRLIGVLLLVATILLVPLIAMQFINDVNWKLNDFIIAGVLLLGTGLACEFIIRKVKARKNRIALFVVAVAILLLIWAELAVGIFGTPLAGS